MDKEDVYKRQVVVSRKFCNLLRETIEAQWFEGGVVSVISTFI